MSKPIAVIRTLEDSPEWLDQRLVEAYLRTTYRVLLPSFEIKIGEENVVFEEWLEEQNAEVFAVITAWNPRSKLLSEEENRLKNKELEVDLEKISRLVLPALNNPDTESWPSEESFFTLDISPDDATRLGKKYEQNAVVWWEKGGVPELWWL